MSAGGVARAWAIETYERDMITPQETLGLPMQWSNIISYLNALKYLVKQPNEFYATLARGTEYAAKKYNSLDFATTLSGLEVSGYHTGPASIVGQLMGIRHSHIDNIGYSVDQKAAKKPMDPEKMVNELTKEGDSRGYSTPWRDASLPGESIQRIASSALFHPWAYRRPGRSCPSLERIYLRLSTSSRGARALI